MKSKLILLRNLCLVALFSITSTISFAQNATSQVKGTVVDDSNKPMQGVSVAVKNQTNRTVTKADGSFIISVPPKSTLVFSFIGHTTQEQVVNDQKVINVKLKAESANLNDVVVIGYGSQRKKEVTGAIATFDAKSIEDQPIARIDQALIGQMSGVQVKQQSGMPGNGLSIVVRGAGSISAGTEPLYVVDGFPLDVSSLNSAGGYTANPLNNLNPDDIENIQVLKDAAAAAIYGSRAANGVVLITTKKGSSGKAVISVNASSGNSQVAKKFDLLSPEEWIGEMVELENYRWVNSGTGRTADQTNAQRRAILGLAANAYNTSYMPDDRWSIPGHPGLTYINWQDSAFRVAPFQNAQISASGGTDAVRYYLSGSYMNQNGVLLNSAYKNYSARANLELTPNKKLKIGINLAPSYSEQNLPAAEGKDNQLHKLASMAPVVEDTAGILTGAGKNSVYGWAGSSVSPVAFLNNAIGLVKTARNLVSLYGEYQILNGLSFRSSVNYDETNQNTKRYVSDFVAGNITNYLTVPGKSSSGSYAGFKKQTFVNENTLNFVKRINDKHSINAIAGMSYSFVHSESFSLSTAGGFANDLVYTLNNAIPSAAGVTVTGTSSETNNALVSYFGRAQYSYAGKYLLSASIRRDASSRFGKDNQWGTFPSLSLGWRISQEKFLENTRWINDLKLRASWGKSGNNNIGDYSAVPTLSNATYNYGGSSPTAVVGQNPSGLPNPNLHWEISNTYDVGLDLSVLGNRINFTADYYIKRNTDLLLRIPVLAATGFTSTLMNIGGVENKGLDLNISTTNITSKDFTWTTRANISFNSNQVTDLGPNQTEINISSAYSGNPAFLLRKGLPMYSYFLINTNGILTSMDTANAAIAKLPKQTVGDRRYLDANGDGIIDANDRVVNGSAMPKYTWGITNTFRYRDFDLSFQIYGQQGGYIYSFFGRGIDNPTPVTLGIWRDRWTAQNQNYNAPRPKVGIAYTIPQFTSEWLYSSDFWRIQNITVGYNMRHIIRSSAFKNARLYLSFQNFFGKDKYYGGANPEAQNTNVSGNGDFPLPGDYGAMPLNKTVTLGLNISLQ